MQERKLKIYSLFAIVFGVVGGACIVAFLVLFGVAQWHFVCNTSFLACVFADATFGALFDDLLCVILSSFGSACANVPYSRLQSMRQGMLR